MVIVFRNETFDGGWGVHPFVGRKLIAHYWSRPSRELAGASMVLSRCGQYTAISKAVPMMEQGEAPQCKRCIGTFKRI